MNFSCAQGDFFQAVYTYLIDSNEGSSKDNGFVVEGAPGTRYRPKRI